MFESKTETDYFKTGPYYKKRGNRLMDYEILSFKYMSVVERSVCPCCEGSSPVVGTMNLDILF